MQGNICVSKIEQASIWRGRGMGMLQAGLLLFSLLISIFEIVDKVSITIQEHWVGGLLGSVLFPC